MKKLLLVLSGSLLLSSALFAQLPVSTSPENKKAVLEEFTGVNCTWCPAGHVIANNIKAADPNNVILINIHSGAFANVNPGDPDFKTPEGNAIDAMPGMGITGYPAGTMNREVLSGSVMAGSRSLWTGWANTIKGQSADCNVALQGTLDVQTRVLTIDVEVYYTANSPAATNSLNVFLLESKIPGPQINGSNVNLSNYNPDGTYNHNHVLRKAITPTFGMTIPTTTMGTLFTAQLTYTIPATYGAVNKTTIPQLGNLEIVAFVAESDRKIINANDGPITLSNFANAVDVGSSNLSAEAFVCAGNLTPSMKFTNLGSSAVTNAVFSYAINGGTPVNYNWTGNVNPMTPSQTFTLGTISFSPQATNSLVVDVVSVNGGTDGNLTNNVLTKSVANNTVIANNINMQMDFTQDRYGTECKWTVYNEVNNTIIATDGPWSDLSSNGTLLHTKNFTVTPSTCYKLVVTDSYGDGINSGYGVGGYVLRSGGAPLITSNGVYGKGETKLYKTFQQIIDPVSVIESSSFFNQISVFPNPSSGITTLNFELVQNDKLGVVVYNQIGQVVYELPAENYSAGNHRLELDATNWEAGLYNVVINGSLAPKTIKVTITK
ncbi:MAG: Omp28-related outer membrane protein [Bacteroidia bacterium]|nr:Omp28-related outer membrane protein [Bacteroidia bacterium]